MSDASDGAASGGAEENNNPVVGTPSLDEVHQTTIAELDNEGGSDGKAGEADDNDDDSDGAAGTKKSDVADGGKSGGEADGGKSGGEADDGKKDDDSADADDDDEASKRAAKPDAAAKPDDKPADGLDTDTTKNGPGKVAIKDVDGETHYFNNLDEVPDDFEPATYKELMKGTKALLAKESDDNETAKQTAIREQRERNEAEVANLNTSWDNDIARLTKDGVLPKDGKARELIVNDVFAYMSKEMTAGNVIDSWSAAYKSYMYDKGVDDTKKQAIEADKTKKLQGGKIMSGGNNAGSTKSRVMEGPPPGVTLDEVHARSSGLI